MNLSVNFVLGLEILITILAISTALAFIRLYLGPTVPNRTAAFDSIAIHAVAILALYAIRIDAPSILDVAIITAVLGFLGTTIMARYLERTAPRYYALSRNGRDQGANQGTNSKTGRERKPIATERSEPNAP